MLTLVSWNFEKEIFLNLVFPINVFEHVLCQISIFVCGRVKHVLNQYSFKFREFLIIGSLEISAFLLKQAVTIFWLTVHTFVRVFADPQTKNDLERQSIFPIVLPFVHYNATNVFTHNNMIAKRENNHAP